MNFKSEKDATTHMIAHNDIPEVGLNEEVSMNSTEEIVAENITDRPQTVEKHYLCEHCTFKSSESKHLIDHKVTVHKASSHVEIYCCDVCIYRTEKSSELCEHKKQVHNDPRPPFPGNNTTNTDICNLIKNEISNFKTQTNFKLDMIVANQRMLLDKIKQVQDNSPDLSKLVEIEASLNLISSIIVTPKTNQYQYPPPPLKPTYAQATGSSNSSKPSSHQPPTSQTTPSQPNQPPKKQTTNNQGTPRMKVLWVGDSHTKNLDKNILKEYTEAEIDIVTAFTVDADQDAKFKHMNQKAIVPRELQKKKFDILVMQSGCNEISNLNCQAKPQDNSNYWQQVVHQSSEKMFDLAKQCVANFPNLKVVILTRLARYDLPEADPMSIKSKLTEYGNNVFTTLWLQNGCPENIIIFDQKLGCYGELRSKRYGVVGAPGYDGIHMRGPLATQHYTNSVLRIFHQLNPTLQSKPFPKFKKTQQHNFVPSPRPLFPKYPGQNNRQTGSRRHFDEKHTNANNYPAGQDQRMTGQNGGHLDCPQTRYQRSGGIANPVPGFTIPTQNRFEQFYNNQGNF